MGLPCLASPEDYFNLVIFGKPKRSLAVGCRVVPWPWQQ
jgi:hypothetical protein